MNRVLLIGNGINNIEEKNPHSWENILKRISKIYKDKTNITKKKPFPLLYEEIYLKTLKYNGIKEIELKHKIANIIKEIEPNEIHEELLKIKCKNILTTNYDYTLEKTLLEEKPTNYIVNEGIIKETKYSVFRNNSIGSKKFWHIHGEVNTPLSITLGFEHYGGQLQHFRNYVSTGTNYGNDKINRLSLRKQLKENIKIEENSWIDFIFKNEVHIIGLSLDYVETDLWYLLTNRARFQMENPHIIQNKIIFYCPSKYKDVNKKQIMDANNIDTIHINENKAKFYKEAINIIKNN